MGLIPTSAYLLLAGLVSIQWNRLTQKSWSPLSVSVWQHVKLSDISLRTCQRDGLVADETKPNKAD